ncbi:DUF3192 domain-containing protein [Pseudoalteromonas denitrificans]|uniref:DUF3192 domain-containing protein n=1 Tax=Pseudoalteromonas denitrificans DSM 6059 TaxID=1123010 RepID=A0A1I1MII0_9GAMM|nr:DUF3192 domain-containing protein [Pseudoalteromonas denitrificans]SFC84936.1 Protein of unknown function [Pseudoalteromonas denitrificans DSM 6059]
MKKLVTTLLFISPLALTGCVIAVDGDGEHYSRDSWEVRQENNRTIITGLNLNQSIDLVKSKLGTPDFYEVYKNQGKQMQILFYRTHKISSDSKTTKDECHFLKFEDSKLIAIGNGANLSKHL